MNELIETQMRNGVVQLRLHEPSSSNQLTEASTSQLMAALERICNCPDARVLVLVGDEDVFSSGASLEELRRLTTGETDLNEWTLPARLIEFPLPIVAAAEGHAVGGGLMIALCSDIVVASESSRYGLNFSTLGFTPGMGVTRLVPALVGHGLAMEMILTGKYYKGHDLAGKGLFNSVVPKERVKNVAFDIAYRIAEQPRCVVEMIKSAMAATRMKALNEALVYEPLMQKLCFSNPSAAANIEETYLT